MAKTSGQLKLAVAAFLQRKTLDFQRTEDGGTTIWDVLLQAMNNARLFAERQIDFEYSKVAVLLPNISVLNGGSLDNAVLFSDKTTPVRVKKILSPFLPIDTASTQFPVDLMTKKSWNERTKRRFEGARPTDTSDFAFITDAPFALVQFGKQIMVVPPDSTAFRVDPFSAFADVVQWLPDYVDGTETDFLLDFCFDWLMYRTIQELNFYQKEDERVTLSDKVVATAWNAVIQWNNELTQSMADDLSDLD